MLEFEANTLAFMTAALEQSCNKLKNDTPEARKYIADKLKACARTGRVGQIALTEAGQEAIDELNGENSNGERLVGALFFSGWSNILPGPLARCGENKALISTAVLAAVLVAGMIVWLR